MQEQETTISKIVSLADDPEMKVIVIAEAIPGTSAAFKAIKEKRPDIILMANTPHEDPELISQYADVSVHPDSVARGYLIVKAAHDLGAKKFMHISFPRYFQRPSLEQIAGVLTRVSKEEGIEVPDAAIGMLARSATGSFRDALGTLEQLVTYGGKEVKLDDVLEILGVADAELVLTTSDSLVDHDPKAALLAVEQLAGSGRDITQFMRDLAAHLRHLYVVQTLGEVPDSFAVTAEHTDRLGSQSARLAQGEVLRAIDLLAAAMSAVKDGSDPRIQLELALLKAVQPQADLSMQALLFRIEQLEAKLSGAAVPAAG